MHGISDPSQKDGIHDRISPVIDWARAHRVWLMVVILPTLIVAAYYCFFASNQYQSEAHFLVRSVSQPQNQSSGLGLALGIGTGISTGGSDSSSVADYLTSHDALEALQKSIGVTDRFQRSDIDIVSRLRGSNPSPERLLSYYQGKVEVRADPDTGIAILTVRSFRPEDSYAIIQKLLSLGEARVNELNQRARDSTLGVAKEQLAEAERNVSDVQAQMTAFRQHDGDFNPLVTGQARVSLVTTLQTQLAAARAQVGAMSGQISLSSPQMIAARARVRALEAQVSAEQGRLASGQGNVATSTGTYESLQLRQQFAAKRYDTAASALASAREQVNKQQLFITRVVNPNYPVKSLFPSRWKIVMTTFFILLLVYGVGWLIAAGVKEHAA